MLKIIPEETVLLVVDPQNDYCHPDGNLGQSGVDLSVWKDVTPRIKKLIGLCRDTGVNDIWSRHYNLPGDAGKAAKRIQAHTAKRKNLSAQPGTWGSEFVDELNPLLLKGTTVIEKYRFSVFYGTTLEPLLNILGTKLLVICGGTTNACIDTTIRDAYVRDYDVVMVEDCIGGVRDDWHKMATAVWQHYLGEVVTLEQFEQMLP